MMPVKVKEGHPMLPARRVMKSWCYYRPGWRQLCGKAMAHYYRSGHTLPLCQAVVTTTEKPLHGVPVPACKACVKARGGKL